MQEMLNLKQKAEERLEEIKFNIYKFTQRPKPVDPKDILIVCCFSEFGCETLGIIHVLPQIKQQHKHRYIIAVGWYGREYLYRHLVDEFWEVKKEHQWLREYTRAFHHISKNLTLIEKSLRNKGIVMPSSYLGHYATANRCLSCGGFFVTGSSCKCGATNCKKALFENVIEAKKEAVKVPKPSVAAIAKVQQYLKPNSVGVFARARKTYGRNLPPGFYIDLIVMLEEMGYNPIWLGEKNTVLPCPVGHVVDFSEMDEAKDLELTLALTSQLKFTIQYWTASTRLASMAGVPYLLFESPDQIYGFGQEGLRRLLCDFVPSKLVVTHYKDMRENLPKCLQLTKQAILEMDLFYNFSEIVDSQLGTTLLMKDTFKQKIHG